MQIINVTLGAKPKQIRRDLQHSKTRGLALRRGIIGMSLVGIGAMGAVTLLQTGIIKHLPDPPLKSFNSDKVNSSLTAYQFASPDGPLSILGLAANIPLAAMGPEDRARHTPAVPIVAALKSGIEALLAGWFFYQMPAKEKAWCGYCITGALMNFGIFAATLPEARKALRYWRAR